MVDVLLKVLLPIIGQMIKIENSFKIYIFGHVNKFVDNFEKLKKYYIKFYLMKLVHFISHIPVCFLCCSNSNTSYDEQFYSRKESEKLWNSRPFC